MTTEASLAELLRAKLGSVHEPNAGPALLTMTLIPALVRA